MNEVKEVKNFRALVKCEEERLAKEPCCSLNYSDWENKNDLQDRLDFLNAGDSYISKLVEIDANPKALRDIEDIRFVLKHEREGREDDLELISAQWTVLYNRIEHYELEKKFNEVKRKYDSLVESIG